MLGENFFSTPNCKLPHEINKSHGVIFFFSLSFLKPLFLIIYFTHRTEKPAALL